MSPEPQWVFPIGAEVSAAADWCEHWTVAHDAGFTRGLLESLIAPSAEDQGHDPSAVSAQVFRELDRRSQIPGYPFAVRRRRRISVDKGSNTLFAYTFMLLLSTSRTFRQNRKSRNHNPTRAFEGLVRQALEQWWRGNAVELLSTGKARRAISNLADLLGVTQPHVASSARQDHGADVVAWKPFADRSEAVPVVVCQCTVSAAPNATVLKARDVVINEWSDLLHVPYTAFIRALAVPRCLPVPAPKWWDITRNSDLFLDRSRLIQMLAPAKAEPWAGRMNQDDMRSALARAPSAP